MQAMDVGLEIKKVEDLRPSFGKVVRVHHAYCGEWLFHLLEREILERWPGNSYVGSYVQVHNGIHGMYPIDQRGLDRGLRVVLANPEEYAGIEFSYGRIPPQEGSKS
jgi:hypothetical protein